MIMIILKPEDSALEAGRIAEYLYKYIVIVVLVLRILQYVFHQEHEEDRHSVANSGSQQRCVNSS